MIFNKEEDGEETRAVSPVIGVILMVAITVILAAVIGSFVMNLGGSVDQNPQVGVSFEENSNSVDVTVNSMPRADNVYVDCSDTTGIDDTLTSVGATTSCSGPPNSVTVTADYEGTEAVVAEWP